MQAIVSQFLEAYARGEMPPGGWLFPTALQQSRLDFSDASLARLDHLLDSIRTRVRPSRELLFDSEPGRNFTALVAFYVIELACRRTGAFVEWCPREAAPQVLADGQALPDEPFARLFARAPDQDVVFFPLGWVESRLLGDDAPMLAAQYLDRTVQRISRAGPAHWWAGMEALGVLASWQMSMAREGAVVPMMLSAAEPRTFIGLGMPGISGSLDEAVQQGAERLATNPDGARWQVLAYDGWLDGPNGHLDAVMLVLQTYGEAPLALKLAFPYRPPSAGRSLVILQPVIQGANQPPQTLELLQGALWRGMDSLRWPDGASWADYRERAAPARATATTAMAPPQSPQPAPQPTPAAPRPVRAARPAASPAPLAPPPDSAVEDAGLGPLLGELRASFSLRQQRMSALSLAPLLAGVPDWLDPADGLTEVLARQHLLLTQGQIVWGALVMAHAALFQPGTDDLPALVVHSADAHVEGRPSALRDIARALYALRGARPEDPARQPLADWMTADLAPRAARDLSVDLAPVLSSYPVQAVATLVLRKHVPTGMLRGGLFPVLTHPSTPAVMLLPFEFWPIELIVRWKDGRL